MTTFLLCHHGRDWKATQGNSCTLPITKTRIHLRTKMYLLWDPGNSGCEIAGKLAEAACSKIWISIRCPPLILPETFLGISITTQG